MAKIFGISCSLLLPVILVCVGSSALIGYNLAIINLPAAQIKEFLNATMLVGRSVPGFVDVEFLYAQVSSVFVIAGAIGAFSCGVVADKLGRRNGLLMNHIFAIVGGVLASLCVRFQSPALLYIGRFIVGINCGITIGIASIYLTEIAPRNLRGAVGATHQLAVTVGICLSYLVTLSWALNTVTGWPIAIGLGAVPAFISLILLPFCPESPRFLYSKKNNEVAARQAFDRLDTGEDIETFMGELREEMELANSQPVFKFTQLFTQRDLRMAVLIACGVQIMQQLSGINAVIAYSSTMMKAAGVADSFLEYAVLSIGILNVIVTIVSLPLLERAGRRTLLLWPTVALILSLVFLTITVTLSENGAPVGVSITSIGLILVYIIGFALGLGPVPALIVSEIFRQGPRAAAYSLSQGLQWTANLIVLFSYPSLSKRIGGYSFLPFLFIAAGFWVFFFFFMPETKNRTFDEVARDLAFGNIVVGRRTAALEDRTMTVFTKADESGIQEGAVHIKPLMEADDGLRV